MNWRDILKEVEEELYSALSSLENVETNPRDVICSVRGHAARAASLAVEAWQQHECKPKDQAPQNDAKSIIRAAT